MLRNIPEDRRPQEYIELATWRVTDWKDDIFSFTSNGGKLKEGYGLIWAATPTFEGSGECPWMYEDRLSADQDFKQGSSNTKQEYYPFGRNLLFHGIVRRFRNEKKICTSAVTLY